MSQLYRQLVSYEKRLRVSLITKTVLNHPTSSTSQYRLRAYRLFTHAEIEDFLENRILEKLKLVQAKWQTNGVISNCLANLLAYCKKSQTTSCRQLGDISTHNDISFRIYQTIHSYETEVKNNNGIKEENIIPLLIQIGTDYTKLSQTLFNNLSSFGSNRGFSAHRSCKVQQLINPNDEINMVSQIIIELKTVDQLIGQIT